MLGYAMKPLTQHYFSEAALKIREEGWMQGARNAETGMYK